LGFQTSPVFVTHKRGILLKICQGNLGSNFLKADPVDRPTTSWLGLRVRIPPGEWMSVSCECCVLLDRCLCDGPIHRPQES